jgi:hypothetical protein
VVSPDDEMTDSEHAVALIRAFIAPNRRERYLTLLGSVRGRTKLRARLAHLRDLDQRFARQIPPSDQTVARIAALLRARGAPADCVLLAEDSALDGERLALDDALTAVVGRGMGTFISCIPGQLAYYEGEEPGERWLLERAG